ncbi:hypothetical protein V1508DRAFT_400640 [Lipomyces doorenjongii]|uniref:uncharacterized protein n=1 Tax=Lipomyces doorenjongii TaxID=383834 RepID=UPI0034CF519B
MGSSVCPSHYPVYRLFLAPRSPRWLASNDQWDEALGLLAFLRSAKGDINDTLVLAEYKEIEDQIHLERCQGSNSLQELFSKKMRSRVFLSMSIQVWSQLCGANVINYYIVYVLKSRGVANSMLLGLIP